MTDSTPPFAGLGALITGAGSGIGRAVALRLAAGGADVVGVDIAAGALDETAALAGGPGSVAGHIADLADPAACREAVEAAFGALGRLDVLGNVAGIAWAAHVTEVEPDAYRKMMAVNADAPFFLSQAAIPHLLASPSGGAIITVASNAGLMGQAYTVPYCMSKGAVVQLTRALAMEFVKTSLRVNALAPAGVDTPLARNFAVPAGVDGALMAPYIGHRPPAHPDEIAAMFAMLLMPESRSVHGAVISIDSGVTAG